VAGHVVLRHTSLDYRDWPYKLLSFVTRFMIGLSGTNKPQEITFLGMVVVSQGRKMVRTSKGYIGFLTWFALVTISTGPGLPLIVGRGDVISNC
jgi:hypothetical protein